MYKRMILTFFITLFLALGGVWLYSSMSQPQEQSPTASSPQLPQDKPNKSFSRESPSSPSPPNSVQENEDPQIDNQAKTEKEKQETSQQGKQEENNYPDAIAGSQVIPVPAGQSESLGKVSFSISDVQDVELSATGPGEVSGKGVKVTVVANNSTSQTQNLNDVTINAANGNNPASPSGDDTAWNDISANSSESKDYYFSTQSSEKLVLTLTRGSSVNTLLFS